MPPEAGPRPQAQLRTALQNLLLVLIRDENLYLPKPAYKDFFFNTDTLIKGHKDQKEPDNMTSSKEINKVPVTDPK